MSQQLLIPGIGPHTHTASEITDFDTEVSNNTSVNANTTHRSNTSNPHSVTAAQVGAMTEAETNAALNAKQAAGGVWFDGDSGMAAVPNFGNFGDGTSDKPFSGSVFIKQDVANNSPIFGVFGTSTATREWAFQVEFTSGLLVLQLVDSSAAVTIKRKSTITVPQDKWVHLGFSYDGRGGSDAANGITLYIDGVDVSGSAENSASYVAMENTGQDFWLARVSNTELKGSLKNANIFNRALSAAEVATLYDHGLAAIPKVDSMDLQESAAHGLGTNAFNSATTVGDWAVFGPSNAAKILAYNPTTNTLQESAAHGLATSSFVGATTVNNWAVFAPHNSVKVLAYNPIANTLQESAAHGLGASAFNGVTTVGDWAVFAPRDADKVLAYNPATNTLQESAVHGLGTLAFYGATSVGDWAVFSPRNSAKVLAYDPTTNTLQESASHGLGTNCFYSTTTVGDWAVFGPRDAAKVLAYNPTTNTLQESAAHGLGTNAFFGATTVNDWAVFAPQNATKVLAYNPIANILQESAAHGLGTNAFLGAITVGDWAVFAPQSSTKVLAYNPVTNTLQESAAHGLGTSAFNGVTTAGDWAVFAPRNAAKVLSLKPPAIKLALPMDEGIGPQLHDVTPYGYHATLSGTYKHLVPKDSGRLKVKAADASSATYMLTASDILPADCVVTDIVSEERKVAVANTAQDLSDNRIRLNPSGSDLQIQRSDGSNHATLGTVTAPTSLSDVDVDIEYKKVTR